MNNILFIGNSYTFFNDMPLIFKALCKENGKECEISSLTKGGRRLVENKTKNDEFSKKVRDTVLGKKYGAVILQDQSLIAVDDPDGFFEGVKYHLETVQAERYILYATWGRKEGSDKLDERSLTSAKMNSIISMRYSSVASKLGCEVSPVGDIFEAIKNRYPELELYNDDKSHPSYLGSCASALIHYKTVFGAMPESFKAFDTDSDIIAKIITLVADI